MASRKEYEMLFALNAKMNGGFSGTFSKAQAEFTRLDKEIQSLHKLQGDISSFQKQQAAVENTRSKLENLQKQHDLLQKEISETNGSTTSLEREKARLEQRIKDTETALDRQTQKLQATGAKLKEAGVDTANLTQKDAELTTKIKELEAEQDKAADSAVSFGQRSAQAFDAIAQSVITSEIINVLGEVRDAFVECVGIAGDFEEAMSTVEALSQASAQDMAALSAEAKELGATTKFTAKESADAMGYMAMAGWDATDMLQGMDGVLQLAAASGEDLAMVSDIVTDSLTAFGLTAADTAHFSDVLAAAATNSNTNVAIMGETFKQSAPLAGALGYSIEDVAVAMGLMANAGVKGSIAGTSLKNIFNGLLKGVTLTGIAFGEYEFSVVKADGTMKDFGSTIDELRSYFNQMTAAEKMSNAEAIAGMRGYAGLLSILNATDADYTSLSDSINNCTGAAQRMAAVKLDNMNGQLTLMNSAWDALKTTIGEQFIPEMRGLYEIGTDVFSGINEFVKANPGIVKGIATAAVVIGTVTAAVTAYTAATKLAIAATALIPGAGQIMAITAAVAGVVGVIAGAVTEINAGIPSVRELTEAAQDMQEAMNEAGASYEDTANQTMATAEIAGIYIDKLEALEAATSGNVAENQEYHNILALLTRTVPELAEYIDLENNVIEGGTKALRQHTEAWKKDAEAQAYQEYINSLYDKYGDVMAESAENSIKLTQAQTKLEEAEKKRDAVLERMNELSEEASANGGMLSGEYYKLENTLRGYNTEVGVAQREIWNLNEAIDADAEAVAAAETEIKSAEAAVTQLTGATEEQTEAEAEAARQTQELQGVIESVTEQMATLAEAYNEAYTAALDSISGQYGLWDQADKVVATSTGNINKALESQITYWNNYNSNLEFLRERADEIDGLREVIDSFADGSTESVNAIAGISEALRSGNEKDVTEMVANYQELQDAQSSASENLALFTTDFQNQMDDLQVALAEDIDAMDFGHEAAFSAQATIQGYIDGANGMLPQVQAAYAKVGRAALDALGSGLYTPANTVGSDLPASVRKARGYAGGTERAEPGWALVGEDGPELMFFNGGEKVLNHTQTFALQTRAAPAISAMAAPVSRSGAPVQITFQIDGNATQETVQDLRAFADEIVDRVINAIDEAEIDDVRGAFR